MMLTKNPSSLLLKDQIIVNHSTARSVNIQYDINDDKMVENYLLTPQVYQSIVRILSGLQNNGSKAWTLTGPYGSGKSFFCLFLARLLSTTREDNSLVYSKLMESDPVILEQLGEILDDSKGYFVITITGYRATLEECILGGIKRAVQESDNVSLINWLENYWIEDTHINGNGEKRQKRLVYLIDEITQVLTDQEHNYKGILFIFDEMGKVLEQASFHKQENDIYLLQEISEHTTRKQNIFLGILHQSFERYATLLDNATQREWAKVQGRFEDIPFQEPPVQQLRLLHRALSRNHLAIFEQTIKNDVEKAAQDGWKPSLMDQEEFSEIAQNVYPLHPSTFAVLPYFFRRLAQNERSIFAFLSSLEPFGFQDFLSKNSFGEYFRLPDLFDYLMANFQGRIYSSGKGRTLSEASDRLDTINNLSILDTKIIKTIGLLNWMSEITQINATEKLILSALADQTTPREDIIRSLNKLKKQSVIVFRRFNQSYIVWQGSDVDLDERISDGYNTLTGKISLAQSLDKYLPPRPLVARKHSFKTGTLRYFEIRYVDSMNIYQIDNRPSESASGICFFCLPTKLSEIDEFAQWAQAPELSSRVDIVVGIANKAIQMADLIYELYVLNWVKEETSELRDDPVARKELRTRISNVENQISLELEESLSIQKIVTSSANQFFHKGKEIDTKSESLVEILSDILDHNYHSSPIIMNEIVNRNKLSTQAAMARKIIIHSILTDSHLDHFGYIGYPPERSIYENLLVESGMHTLKSGFWTLQPPEENAMNLLPTWQFLESKIFSESIHPIAVRELFNELHAPPYGMAFGVVPILLCVFMKVNTGETTLYKQDMLLPEPSIAHWDLLVSRPDLFSVAGFHIKGARKKLVERFARGFNVKPELMPVVRTLVKGVNSLPDHSKITRRMSTATLAVREVIQQATSPERMLFEEIPKALGLESIQINTPDQEIETFFEYINETNKELIGEMDRLLFWARDELLKSFSLESSESGWGIFRVVASKLASITTNPIMKPLYLRATDTEDSYAALDRVLAYIANRPPRNWTDMDCDQYLSRLSELSEAFKREQQQFAFEFLFTSEQRKEVKHIADKILKILSDDNISEDYVRGAISLLYFKLSEKD